MVRCWNCGQLYRSINCNFHHGKNVPQDSVKFNSLLDNFIYGNSINSFSKGLVKKDNADVSTIKSEPTNDYPKSKEVPYSGNGAIDATKTSSKARDATETMSKAVDAPKMRWFSKLKGKIAIGAGVLSTATIAGVGIKNHIELQARKKRSFNKAQKELDVWKKKA